ncbi:MFS transporter [Leifsonia sp. C5G2]|uniref:MFS transporter n=1 Tax=Leifsonia sp. C5G2 TaxID=2735269 RepID=UPI00158541FB|nr:MFS transporter [Leifsonia sp. C5G2]NUU08532.1 MFS transporter [Leifsonia sp. C5G2]
MRNLSLRTQVGVFSALFASGMWMAKVAQPLHYEGAGALVAFGVGYGVMACVGGLSFAWGAIADRLGGLTATRTGILLYAVGIAGRVFTDLLPTVAFSAIAGAGASLALVGLRPWIRSAATDDLLPRVIATRSLGSQVGVFVGTLGAAGLFLLFHEGARGTTTALLLAALLALMGFAWMLTIRAGAPVRSVQTEDRAGENRRRWRPIAAKLAVVGLLSGFYVSTITPYLPLYLTSAGMTDAAAATVIAAMSVVQMGATAILARRGRNSRPLALFLITELSAGLITLGLALALGLAPTLIVLLFLARAALVAIAVTAEETIQYAVIPGNAAGFVFGISQTAFLIGDALGGFIGGPIWTAWGPVPLAIVAGVATVVNAVLLPVLFWNRAAQGRRLAVDVGS